VNLSNTVFHQADPKYAGSEELEEAKQVLAEIEV
jgi:hypothetical protein